MIDGKPYTASFTTFEEAKAHDLELEHAAVSGEAPPERATTVEKSSDIKTMLDLYDHACKTEWPDKSRILRDNARRFTEWVGSTKMPKQGLTPASIDAYTIQLQHKQGLSPKTVNRYLSAISVLLKVAKRHKLAEDVNLPWRKETKGRIRYFTHEEEGAIYRALRNTGYDEILDLLMVLCDTGGRLEEVRRIKWPEVKERWLEFVKTKTDLERVVPLTERAKSILDRRQATHGHLAGPFYGPGCGMHALRDAWLLAKKKLPWMDKECVPHTFRHTCCTRLILAGYEVFHVQQWMGHKTIATTRKYAHINAANLVHMTAGLEQPKRVVANDDQAPSKVA
jgi:integrase